MLPWRHARGTPEAGLHWCETQNKAKFRGAFKASDISCSNLVMLVHVVHYSTPLCMSTTRFVTVAILAQGILPAGAAEQAFLTFSGI